MDVLVSGSERTLVRLPRPPRWLVVTGVLAVLAAVVAGVLLLQRAERRAADLSDVQVALQVESSSREYGGALYGTLAVQVLDPRGGPLRLGAVAVQVPGVHHAPARGLPVVGPDGRLTLRLRFVVFACGQLGLPGQVVLQAARGEREAVPVRRPVRQGTSVDGRGLLVACGRLPQGD